MKFASCSKTDGGRNDAVVDNLHSWAMQVSVIASIGAVLPLVLHMRHPQSQLAYCHPLLTACLVLPVVQP
jgi:hypothetical protein